MPSIGHGEPRVILVPASCVLSYGNPNANDGTTIFYKLGVESHHALCRYPSARPLFASLPSLCVLCPSFTFLWGLWGACLRSSGPILRSGRGLFIPQISYHTNQIITPANNRSEEEYVHGSVNVSQRGFITPPLPHEQGGRLVQRPQPFF